MIIHSLQLRTKGYINYGGMRQQSDESYTESEVCACVRMQTNWNDHPLGSSRGLEHFRELWKASESDSDLSSNVAGTGTLQ